MPHRVCLLGNWPLIATVVTSDLLIFASYVAISLGVLSLTKHRQLVGFLAYIASLGQQAEWIAISSLLWTCGFVFMCAQTHLMAVITLWFPRYYLAATISAVTAIVSVGAAVSLGRLMHAFRGSSR